MSVQTRPKINNKYSDDQDDNEVVDVKKKWDQEDVRPETDSSISNNVASVESSTSSDEVSSDKLDHLDLQGYEVAETSSFKLKVLPRAIEKAQNRYKRSLTSPKTRKPQVVKKPKLDYPLKSDQFRAQQTSYHLVCEPNMAESVPTDIAKGDNECCHDSVKEKPSTSYVTYCDEIGTKLNEEGTNKYDQKINCEKEEFEIEKSSDLNEENSCIDEILSEGGSSLISDGVKIIDCPDETQYDIKSETLLEEKGNSEDPNIKEVKCDLVYGKSKNVKGLTDRTSKSVPHTCISSNKLTFMSDTDNILPANKQLAESKVKSLLNILQSSPEGADAKLSLFMSGCSHNVRNLNPFPHKIFEDNDANRHLLYFIAEEIPSVDMIKFYLKETEIEPIRKELMPIIDWLIRCVDPRLESVKAEDHKNVISQVSSRNVPKEKLPSKIFRIKNRRTSHIETFWQETKGDAVTKYAFYGCKVEDAYSILHRGFHIDLSYGGNLGSGFYMTDNLAMCVDSCVAGNTWGKSSLATKVKVVFVVEFIFNHGVMSYSGNGKPYFNDNSKEENVNSRFYYTVKPQLGRMRYLLLYVESPSILPKNPFLNGPFRKKMIKYLNILRISLLIATILMGATASKRSIKGPSFLLDAIQTCYYKFSNEMVAWPIWNYVEIPYIAVPLTDSLPHSCSQL